MPAYLAYRTPTVALLFSMSLAVGCASTGRSAVGDSAMGAGDGGVDTGAQVDSSVPRDTGAVSDAMADTNTPDTGAPDTGPAGCAVITCAANATCMEDASGARCVCDPGFEGDGDVMCDDVDECVPEDPCGMGMCINAPGGYSCTCDPGFMFDGTTCVDVDECSPADPCGMGTCTNAPGSYSCACDARYAFDGTTCVMVTGTVLVFRGSTRAADTTAADAVTALGLTLIDTTTDTMFNAAFDAGGFDVIVWTSPSGVSSSTLTAAVETRLTSWISGGGALIFAYWDLDTESSFESVLGVSATERNTWVDVRPVAGDPYGFFSGLPATLTGEDSGWADNGDNLALTGAGTIAATFTSGSPSGAIAVTHGGRVVTHGFVFSDCLTQDVDMDGVPDCQELAQNELTYLLP